MKDCHIHLMPLIGPEDPPAVFMAKAAEAGVAGGTIMSLPPVSFRPDPERSQHWRDRLEHIMQYTSQTPGFHPFFWIDPTEADIFSQISTAVEAGVRGFKCICNHFAPKSCLKQFSAIAETGLPIHFHSGILFDHYASGEFLRPLAFEPLLEIRNIRFALAHLGNPWYDECILLHAKFKAAVNNVPGVRKLRMFFDLPPGVGRVRRMDALRMLLLSGYTVTAPDILWGTDNRINNYDVKKALFWRDFDRQAIAAIIQESRENPGLYPPLPDELWEMISERNFTDYYGI